VKCALRRFGPAHVLFTWDAVAVRIESARPRSLRPGRAGFGTGPSARNDARGTLHMRASHFGWLVVAAFLATAWAAPRPARAAASPPRSFT